MSADLLYFMGVKVDFMGLVCMCVLLLRKAGAQNCAKKKGTSVLVVHDVLEVKDSLNFSLPAS